MVKSLVPQFVEILGEIASEIVSSDNYSYISLDKPSFDFISLTLKKSIRAAIVMNS